MSPLRPALSNLYRRKPRPRAMRQLACPACGSKIQVSQKAMSLRCPQCTQPIQLDDFVLEQSTEGRLKTMGQVTIAPGCDMIGDVTCGAFHNQGGFDGQLLVYGPVALLAGSHTKARVKARAFEAIHGAAFVGRLSISPRVGQAPADAHPFPLADASRASRPSKSLATNPPSPTVRNETVVPTVVTLKQTRVVSPQVV